MNGLCRACVVALVALAFLGGCKNAPNARLRQLGFNAMDTGENERALAQFERAVVQNPTDWKAQLYLGKMLNKQGRPLDAQIVLERALAMRREHAETPQIIDELAESLFLQEQYEALHNLLASSASEHGTVYAYLRQAEYLGKMREVDGARVAYAKAAHFAEPGDVQPYVRMAHFYHGIGDTAGEIRSLRYAHYVRPGDPNIASKLREHGIIPGPAAALQPQRD